jgi:hypothetical protein
MFQGDGVKGWQGDIWGVAAVAMDADESSEATAEVLLALYARRTESARKIEVRDHALSEEASPLNVLTRRHDTTNELVSRRHRKSVVWRPEFTAEGVEDS